MKAAIVGCGVLVVALAVTAVVVESRHPNRSNVHAAQSLGTTSLPGASHRKGGISGAAPSSLVATLHSDVPRYAAPTGVQTGSVPATWFSAPSALPVIAQDNGYLEVRLAQRPNGSTAWIPASEVTLSTTPYRVVINLTTEHLMLYKEGQLEMSAPVGIGTVRDPTPTGNFFVALYANPPSPAWGPFIMVTSGHSTAISDWEKSGDAIVAIHGPLGANVAIGTTGGRVSHGCVRLHNADLVRLRDVPVGSPVQITD